MGASQLFTYKQAAERLGVSTRTIERLVSEGRIAYAKVRGSRRISDDAIAAYVKSITTPARGLVSRPGRPIALVPKENA
jgi:excisionase family DNA binding protein